MEKVQGRKEEEERGGEGGEGGKERGRQEGKKEQTKCQFFLRTEAMMTITPPAVPQNALFTAIWRSLFHLP